MVARKKAEDKGTGVESAETTKIEVTEPVVTDDPVAIKLKNLGIDDDIIEKIKSELGVETVEDLYELTESYLTSAGIGMKPIKAAKLIKALTAENKPCGNEAMAAANTAYLFDSMLPKIPSDESWIEALQSGGIRKVNESTVIAAIRAALAAKVHFFEVPSIVAKAMEDFSEESEEQVPDEYFELRNQVVRHSYAEIFSAIKGLDGSFVTESRKQKLLQSINRYLWPALLSFDEALREWYELWVQTSLNPTMMMSMLRGTTVGPHSSAPETGPLHDAATDVINAINKVFAGTGVQIASAMAYDATKIQETLMDARLPAMVGAPGREQMLKKLDIGVPATYIRTEKSLTRYVLAIMSVKDLALGTDEESRYFETLYKLGSQIKWDQLREGDTSTKGPTGIGGNLRNGL